MAADTLRIAVPTGLPAILGAVSLRRLAALGDTLHMELHVAAEPAALMARGEVDLAVVLADIAPDGPWDVLEPFEVEDGLVATDAYIAGHGEPRTPADLAKHTLVLCRQVGEPTDHLPLRGGGKVDVQARFVMDHADLALRMAVDGAGLAYTTLLGDRVGMLGRAWKQMFDEATGSDRVRRVLADQVGATRTFKVLMSTTPHGSTAVQTALETLRRFAELAAASRTRSR